MKLTRRAALTGLALLGNCSRPEGGPVRIVAVGVQEFFLPFLAQELGTFRDAGVEVKLDVVAGGTKAVEALMAGSSHVMYGNYENTLLRAPEGRRLRAFLVGSVKPGILLVVAPAQAHRIRRMEDLKGATVGIGSFGGPFHRTLEHFLSLHRLKISDVHVAVAGVGASAVAALEHGKVDAGMLNRGAYNVLRRRAPLTRVLVDPRSREEQLRLFGVEELPGASLLAREDWLAGHRAEALGLAQGMLATMRWIREHTLEEVAARLPEGFRSGDREADIETMGEVADSLSKDGRMPPGGPEAVARIYTPEAEREREPGFDLSKTYTDEFVKRGK